MSNRLVAGGGIQSESISDFDPRTLGGCMLWLDAADSNTLFTDTAGTMLAANGDLVARWNDKANPGKFVRQNTSSLRPAYLKPSNSLPVVNFTGTNSGGQQQFEFSDTSTPPMPVGTDPATYFIVAKPNVYSPSASGNFVISYGSFTTGGERSIALYGPPNNIARFVTAGPNTDIATGTLPTTIVSAMYSNFTTSFTVNGGTPVIRDVQSSNLNTGTSNYIIGNYQVGGSPFYGYVSEIIVFNRALQNDERQQMEGYLAWKWGLVQNLSVTHPYYYAKAPQTAFQPTNFPSCALWLDAADRNTVSGPVTQWNDKSGNGRHFVAAGSSPTPTFSNRAFSGRPGIEFTRNSTTSRSVLEWTNNAAPLVTSDITVMMLVRRTATNTGRDRLLSATSSINTSDLDKADSFGFVNSNVGVSVVERFNNTNSTSPTVGAISSGVSEIITMTINRSTLTSTIRQTLSIGTTTGTRTGEPDSNLSLKQLRLGITTNVQEGTGDSGQNTFEGVISEVLIYNSVLSSSQLINLEGYLAWKYGLAAILLPSSHQYYTGSPVGIVPTNITGCQLWLDASDVSSMNLSVTQWNDKAGRSFNPYVSGTPTYNSLTRSIVLNSSSGLAYENPYTLTASSTSSLTFSYRDDIISWSPGAATVTGTTAGGSATYNITSVSVSGSANPFTITLTGPFTTAFTNATSITVASATNPSALNDTYTLVTSTTTSVTFTRSTNLTWNPKTTGSATVRGTIAGGASATYNITGVSVTGTSATYNVTLTGSFTNAFSNGTNVFISAADNPAVLNGVSIITGGTPLPSYSSFVVFGTPSTFSTKGRILGFWDSLANDYTGPNALAVMYLDNSGGVNGLVTSQRGSAYPTTVDPLNPSTTYLGTITGVSGGSFSVGINGVTTGNLFATSASGSGAYNNLTKYYIGQNSGNGERLNGSINEVLLFNTALTTAQRQQVEGYLAWKWNLALPSSHPFTQANYFFNNTRPFSRYFNPPDIEGCQLWIDAADANTVTLNDSGNVTSILDKSGLANNISNTGSTVTYTSTLNSRPVLTFPSTGTVAGNTLSTPSLTRDPVNFSAFYVCRYPSSGASPIQAINFDLSTTTSTTISGATNAASTVLTVGSSDQFAIGRHVIITGVTPTGYNQAGVITAIANSTQITVELSRGAPGVAYTSGGSVTQLTASHMFGQDGIVPNFNIQNVNYEAGTASRAITSFTHTSPTLINNTFILGCVRQNGVFTLSTNGITHITTSPALTAIGNKTTGAYSIFGGVQGLNIAEVIIYNAALTATERQSIEGYLSWKWGIQRATSSTNPSVTSGLTYPTTHPYYNFPPVDVTPMTPALRLYKKPFDPSDLSPVIWIDPQDSNVVTRETGTTNRVTQIVNKGTFAGNFTPPSGIGGPLFTRSSIGNGTGVEFLDFSNGGHYQVTSATMEDATTMALTVFPPHNGEIPLGALVNFTPTRGTYSNGSSATLFTAPIPIIIANIEVDNRTLTITTSFPHGVGNSQSIYLTVNTATYFGGGDASGLTGQYTTTSIDNTASTIKILLDSNKTAGLMAITDAHIRNNLGTSGPYITQNGTSGSTVKLTTYGTRSIGNLNDFMGRIEYGSLPITSGEIGSSSITLSSVATNIFTASNTSGITSGCPLIPSTSGLGLTGGTMYYVASVSGSTFRLASTLQNVISGTLLTFSNATANVEAVCYGTRATLRTVIDHGISTNQLVNVNLGNQHWLPYQTQAQTAGTCNPAVIQFKTASVAVGGTTLNIDLSTMPTGTQNPFFTLVSGTVTYTTRGTFTIYFPAGAKFGTGASAAEISLTGLSTTANATNNTATKMEFTITTRPEGTITFDGLPGIIICTANFATSNANQINLVATTTSVSGNTITVPLPTSYPGVGGTTIANIGRLLRATGPVEYGQISPLPSILYPVKGFALENTSLSSSLSSTTQTIIIANHLTSVPNRWSRLGSGTQPPIVATATTANGQSGGVNNTDPAGYSIRLSAFANAPRLSIRHAAFGNSHNNSSLSFFTDTTNPFRVITTYLNLTSDAIADCPAYSRGDSMGAYSYDTLLYNNSGGIGPTRITPGMLQGTINPAHIRIGGETSVGSTYSTTNQLNTHWYEGGVGDILIFNRILPVEERRLVEGYLAQKYRTTGTIGGSSSSINDTAISYAITGSSAITGTSPNFTITLTGTFTVPFIPGSRITIRDVSVATGLNNTWTVVTANTTNVTFLSSTNVNMLWASGNGGTIGGYANTTNAIATYNITSSDPITGTSPNFTITVKGTFTNPFIVASRITIAGVATNIGLNNTWKVESANTTTVTFISSTNTNMLWASGNGGTISGPTLPTYNITGSAAITGSSPNFTITVTGTFTNPFIIGSRVTIAGVTTNTGLNNTWTVLNATTTLVTFLSPTNTNMLWASGNGGTISGYIVATASYLHPYRLNPTTIAGQNTLSLTSTTAPYAQNLVAWFDAANPNLINNATLPANGTPATNNTAVTLWAPTSGWWANTPLQLENSGTATYHSTTVGRTQNGLGGIYIGGSTNRLSLATATGAFTQYTTINANNNFTWTVVFRPDSVSATTPVLSVTNGTSNRLMLCSDGTFIYSNGTTSQTVAPSVLLTNAKTHMITVYRDGATVGFRIVSEDVAIGYSASTSAQTNLVSPTFTTPTLTFGAIGVTGFATSFTGSIFEAALFRSTLSTQAIQQVEGYLASKWGLQGSLPASHAYKELSA